MSPFDMWLFFFFILVTIKASVSCIDYWRDVDAELEEETMARKAAARRVARPAVSSGTKTVRTSVPVRTVKTVKPAARITPIKRVNAPAAARHNSHVKDKGAA